MQRITVGILGTTIAVDIPPEFEDYVRAALAQRAVVDPVDPTQDASLFYELRNGDDFRVVSVVAGGYELIDTADSIDAAVALIVNNLHPLVAERHPDWLVIHAGAVAWNGQALIFPGRSHSGKSSLVAALLRRGATYLSDEYALLDAQGNVHPYPRHLSMRHDDGSTTLVPADFFRAETAAGPVPLGLIVDTSYSANASFEPEVQAGASALLTLVDNALVARTRPAHTMKIIASLGSQVTVVRSLRGDAYHAAEAILAYAAELPGARP